MSIRSVNNFIELLRASPRGAVFNPWWEMDKANDIHRQAPEIRRRHLQAYLCARLTPAKVALIGEALGYRGGHFSGIPMTSERLLLGKAKMLGTALPGPILNIPALRSSKPSVCAAGFSEPTATIVWSALLRFGLRPDEFVLWNAFPWHPFDPRTGLLSNRAPSKAEQSSGVSVLKKFVGLFSGIRIIALGRIAEAQLKQIQVASEYVRHPASGGARRFREDMERINNCRGLTSNNKAAPG